MEALWILLGVFIGAIIALIIFFSVPKLREKLTKKAGDKLLKDAENKADKYLMNAKLDAKNEIAEMKKQAEIDIKERKASVIENEKKLDQREAAIDTMASGMATEAEKAAATAAEMAAAKEALWAANSEEEWAWLVAQLKKLLKEAQGRRSSVRESKSNGGK